MIYLVLPRGSCINLHDFGTGFPELDLYCTEYTDPAQHLITAG